MAIRSGTLAINRILVVDDSVFIGRTLYQLSLVHGTFASFRTRCSRGSRHMPPTAK